MKKYRIGDYLLFSMPLILGFMLGVLNQKLSIVTYNSEGLDNIFNHFITFSSIVIGVLIALYGVVISIDDTPVMKEIRRKKASNILVMLSVITLIFNFLLLVYSIVLQFIIINESLENIISYLISFYIGLAGTTLLYSSFSNYYLLKIPLYKEGEKELEFSNKMDPDEEKKLQEQYTK